MPSTANIAGTEPPGGGVATSPAMPADASIVPGEQSKQPSAWESVGVGKVIEDERSKLGLDQHEQPTALCLSGGGIRSATFSLGVLQGLAKLGRLRTFHYVSSVSGGSYIALWLAAWIRRSPGGIADVERALGDSIAHGGDRGPVQRLRAYSNFLSPVHGLSADSVSVLAICARNLLLHWTMILPIVFAVLLLPRLLYATLLQDSAIATGPFAIRLWAMAVVAFAVAIAFASYDTSRSPPVRSGTKKVSSWVTAFFLVPVFIGSLVVVVDDPSLRKDFGWTLALVIMAGGAALQAACEVVGRYVLARAFGTRAPASTEATRPGVLGLLAAAATTGAVASGAVLAALAGARHFFPDVAQRTTLCFPLVLAALAFSNIVRAGLSQRWTAEDVREWWGRASGIVAMVAFAWLALSLVVIQVPSWLLRWASTWSGWTAGIAGVGSVALAVATTMFGFWSKHGSEVKEKALGVGRALGLRTMEVAAGASVLVIAVALSLVLGLFATNEWFRLDAAAIPSTACTSAPREALRAHAPPMNDLSSLQKREACTVLTGLAASKPALYCTQAATMCGGTCPAQPLPAACNTLEAPANNVADISAGADTQASTSVSPPTSWSSRASSSFPTRMDARANLVDETAIFQQLAAANFALGWLIRHEQSLMDRADRLLLLALALVAFAIGASYLFGANAFSLNAFYGNRLTRAYLGASQPKGKQHPHPFTGFDLNDNLPLKDLAPVVDGQGVRLLPIVNTALNLLQPSGDRLEWQERKAESFFMTPYYCGSKTLGFVSTEHYASRGSAGLSAGRAMAISGAAASPAMGYHSSPLVTLLMAFFNVRLGWWMPNPARQKFWRKEPLFGIGPILSEMLSSVSDKRRFVYLSDGGHFENLGLYEMVRRRCRTILVVDAVCDADYQYEDLEDAVRKIRIDLGVPITFADGLLTPERARATGCHYCTGAIGYSALGEGWEDGRIVYIKPVLSGDEPVDVRHYAETTRSDGRVFPQQPTSDQFFDEAQFESYRELGLHSVIQAFAGAGRGWPRAVPFKSMSAVSTTGDATLRDAPLPKWAPTPPSKESASSGLLGALTTLGPLGQAAMVASITAAFTVTGTVALKDAHVTLNDATVKLAPAEVNLKRDDHPLPVTIDARDVATGVGAFLQSTDPQDRATREAVATALAAQLSAIKVKLDVNGTLIDPALMAKMQTLIDAGNGVVVDLKDASKDLKTAGVVLRGQLKPVLESVAKAIETSNGKATALNEGLQQIRQAINKLDGTVDRISPRQTVRGSGS